MIKDEEGMDLDDKGLMMSHASGRPHTILLRSGRLLDFADPQPEQFTLEDIANGLGRECRFARQCHIYYSVAQHLHNCWLTAVDRKLDKPARKAILMHDAAEAFMGDMPRPLKLLCPEFKAIEHRLLACIGKKYGIDFEAHKQTIDKIDLEVLIAERDFLFPEHHRTVSGKWVGEDAVAKLDIRTLVSISLSPDFATDMFLNAAKIIGIPNI